MIGMKMHMRSEIFSQAEAWRSAVAAVRDKERQIAELLEGVRGREVRFLGSGSSYYLSLSASLTWARQGWWTRVLPSSEQLLNPACYPAPQPPLALGISRSGATTETVKALAMLQAQGSPTIGISTEPGNVMADYTGVMVGVTGGQEQATVQTRSFSGQLIAAQALAFLGAGDSEGMESLAALPELAETWLNRVDEPVSLLAKGFKRAYFLGTGERWGLALEAALKLKETSLTEAEGFQYLEFRHGPQSMVDEETLVVGLVSSANEEAELAVLREMKALGGQVLAIGEDLSAYEGELDSLSFRSSLPERARGALYLPPIQLLAYYRGLSKGLDPDHPRHLTFAVELTNI